MLIKILQISFKKILEAKLLNIFLILQIFIVVVVLNISIGKIQHSSLVTKITEHSDMAEAYYIAPKINIRFGLQVGQINQEYEQKFTSLKNVDSIESIKILTFAIQEIALNINVMSYSEKIINSLRLPLSKGKWFDDIELDSNDYIPVIISHSLSEYYHVGDFIQICGISTNHLIKVVGILDQQDYYMSFQSAGDFMCIDEVYEKGKNIIICPENVELNEDKLVGFEQGKLIFLKEIFAEDIAKKEIFSSLKDTCYINSVKEMIANQKLTNRHDIILQFVHMAIALVLALAGIGGTNALSMIFQEKEFALYFMCGLRWKWCVLIVAIKNSLILIISALLSFVALDYLITKSYLMDVLFNINNFVITFCLICGIYLVTSLGSLLRMYRYSPISIIRRWD